VMFMADLNGVRSHPAMVVNLGHKPGARAVLNSNVCHLPISINSAFVSFSWSRIAVKVSPSSRISGLVIDTASGPPEGGVDTGADLLDVFIP